MPRPGPRPYECVRRAWHSERHQPMRGSIIQQIFRVVHERHGMKTKKNREWQEKLPVVVLKAEEIMYSKANSEAEYMDLATLWDRVNDAIGTIIRRDESSETGQLLPPCVEAALNLGCIPIRASRSQRHSTPRSYLGPRTEDTGCVSPNVSRNEQNASMGHVPSATQSTSGRTINVNSVHRASESNSRLMPHMSNHSHLSPENVSSPANNSILPVDTTMVSNVGSVYPLYYGTDFQPKVCQIRSLDQQMSNKIVLGQPIFPSVAEPAEVGGFPSLSHSEHRTGTHQNSQQHFEEKICEASEMECDLSLRLGLSSNSGLGTATGPPCGIQGAAPSDYHDGAEFGFGHLLKQNEFSFFPVAAANDPPIQQSGRWNAEGEGQFPEGVIRKRKAPVVNMDRGQFSWQEGPTSNHFAGRMKRPGVTPPLRLASAVGYSKT